METSGGEQVSNAGARREHGHGRVASALSELEAEGVGVGQGQSMSHHSCVHCFYDVLSHIIIYYTL